MIIYNVTIQVTWTIHDEWLRWLKEIHIPKILGTGCFFEYRIVKLLEVEEDEGPTYAIQFHASTMSNYQHFIKKHEALIGQQFYEKWREQVVAFSSLMEVVH